MTERTFYDWLLGQTDRDYGDSVRPLAVLAALAAGCTADFFVERADWRRIRTETVHEKEIE